MKPYNTLSTKIEYYTTIDLRIGSEQGLRLLAEQKRVVADLAEQNPTLFGLLCFLDHIQDTLVDEVGLPEKLVFPFKEDQHV